MAIEFPKLPFSLDALEPHISKKTLELHYGKHHKHYVDQLNELIKGTALDKFSLEEIMQVSHGRKAKIYNNAGQAWNHNFMWNCLTNNRLDNRSEPSSNLKKVISKMFNSFDEFKDEFSKQAAELFGSGWAWLVKGKKGQLQIHTLSNAENPRLRGEIPLLTCDVWEHAYYLDYQNDRAKYLENFWPLINWEVVEANLELPLTKPELKIIPPETMTN